MQFQVQAPEALINWIKGDEGFEPRPYTGPLGYQHIGIGFCLDKTQMPETVADYWCGVILDRLHTRLQKNPSIGRTYSNLNEPRQWAIINMSYQLGLTGCCNFLDMWSALDKRDYIEAAKEALNSVWATQTPRRAHRIARIIESGEIQE